MFKCPICYETYRPGDRTYARLLGSCGHDLCEKCLQELVENESAKCPTCRKRLFDDKDTWRALKRNRILEEQFVNERFPRLFTLSSGRTEPNGATSDDTAPTEDDRTYHLEQVPSHELLRELFRRGKNRIELFWLNTPKDQKTQALALCQGIPLLIITIWFISRYL
ncbi:RING finger protein [Gregarina niphandrodes]|uniref:RING finger protein n=1 Tax=Gregarina niphandrodes TaxID=110365 RepID=A0A023BAT6_GRENI|nr:RING finger protein [Gregarina niphandrodes]EZG78630.1 RING finger protein [Gregarina niphandrodes]|eukprot:XP_011129221.1 RING finger protein [Gregarina niphandrodes]